MADIQANIGIGVDTSQALAAIRQLQREISAFHTSMAKGGALASANSARLSQNLVNTINATGQFSSGMTRIQSSAESFTNALEKNKLSMNQYFRFAGGASRSFGKMFSKEFNTINRVASERVKDLQTQYISMGRDANGALQAIRVRPLALDMDNLGTRVQMVAQKQQLFNQLLKQGSTNLLNFGKNTQWAGRQLMVGFTIPLTIFGGLAIKEFQKIEEQVVKFRRVYGDMFNTDADTEKALSNVRELAEEFTKYGIAVEKTIGLAAKVAQMGNVGTDLTEQVTQATRLAVLGGLEQEEALDTTISLTNAFGIAAEDLAGKIAFLNAAENQTILAIEDFNTAIPLSGSVVRQLGGDVEDLAVLLTAMREGGINASQAGNALKTSLGRLISPSRNAKETLGSFGIDVLGIVNNNAGDLMGTINTLAFALEKLDPLNRARSIEALFGKFQFARMSTMFQNIVAEGSQANKVLGLAANSTAELAIIAERELSKVEQSPAFKLQKQMEALKASLAPIGEEFVKAIGPLIEFGTRLLKSFNNLGEGGKQFVVILTALAGVVAPAVLMVVGLVANGIANLVKFVALLGRGFAKLSGSSRILGTGTEYMTQQQIEAAAVAASLGQSHSNLIQVFTAEATAVRNLAAAYRQAIVAQGGFGGTAAGMRGRTGGTAPKKYNKGVVMVPGPKGAGDIVPAMLSPGEAVIPAAQAQKYSGFIENIISDNVPGYMAGKLPEAGPQATKIATSLSSTGSATEIGSIAKNIQREMESSVTALGLTLEKAGDRLAAALESVTGKISKVQELTENPQFVEAKQERVKASLSGLQESHLGPEGKKLSSTEFAKLTPNRSDVSASARLESITGNQYDVDQKHALTRKLPGYINQPAGLDPAQMAQIMQKPGGKVGVPAEDVSGYMLGQKDDEVLGAYSEAFKNTGVDANDTELQADVIKYDRKLAELLKERAGKRMVDTAEHLAAIPKDKQGDYFTLEGVEAEAAQVLPPGSKGAEFREAALATTREGRRSKATVRAIATDFEALTPEQKAQFPEKEQAAISALAGRADKNLRSDFELGAKDKKASRDKLGIDGVDTSETQEIGQNIVDSTANAMNAAAEASSPAKRFIRIGENIVNSTAMGMEGEAAEKTGKPPLPGNLAAPKAPTPPPIAPLSRGAKLKNAVLDSAPSKFLGKKLAQASGVAVTDSKGEVFYDPNKDPNNIFGQMEAKAAADRAKLPGGSNYSPDLPNVAGGAPLPVRVVDGFEMDPQFQETVESGQIQTENLNETIQRQNDSTDKNTAASKEEVKTDKRQKRASLAGKMLGGLGTATMVAGMATQAEGAIGETAQKIVGPLAAISGILPVLTAFGPVWGSIIALLGAGAALWYLHNKAVSEARKETYELGKAMGTGKEAMQKFAEFSGKVTSSEIADRERLNRQSPLQLQPGQKTFGSAFIEGDPGQEMVANTKLSIQKIGEDATIKRVYSQLGQAVLSGALDQAQAQSIAAALGQELEDFNFGIKVNADLIGLFGPNGENLLKDPLKLQTQAFEEVAEANAKVLEDGFSTIKLLQGTAGAIDPQTGYQTTVFGDEAKAMIDTERQRQSEETGFLGKIYLFFKGDSQIAKELQAAEAGNAMAIFSNNLETSAQGIDAVRLATQNQINEAIKAGATQQEIDDLKKEEAEAIAELTQAVNDANAGLLEWWSGLPKGERDENVRDQEARIKASAQEAGMEGPELQALGRNLIDLRKGDKDSLELQEYNLIIRTAVESGMLTEKQLGEIVDSFNTEEDKEIIASLITDVGAETYNLLSIIGDLTDPTKAQEILLSFKTLDRGQALEKISDLDYIYKTSGIFDGDLDIPVNFFTTGSGDLKETMDMADQLRATAAQGGLFQDGEINMGAYADAVGEDVAARAQVAAAAIGEEFDALSEAEKLEFYTNFAINAQFTGDPTAVAFLKSQSTELGLNLDFGQKGSEQEQVSADRALGEQIMNYIPTTRAVLPPGEEEAAEPVTTGGEKSVDSLIKKLRDLRLATIDMKKGWEGMQQVLESVFAGGTKGINVFEGLSNQIRRMGVGENLIEMIVGMDPDEYNKRKNELFVFDAAGNIVGTTAKLKNMNSAFNAIAIGEYINSQQSFIEKTKNQISAISILTASGMSLAEAYQVVQDETLAAAVAMGATKAEIEEIIRITGIAKQQREAMEEQQERSRISESVRKTNEEFRNQVNVLNQLSKAQGKYTDAQIGAIMNDKDLQKLFLNPSIDPRALEEALRNAESQANLNVQIALQTQSGQLEQFAQLQSEVNDYFAKEEAVISVAFEVATANDSKIVEDAQRQIADIQYKLDDYNAELEQISWVEDDINEKYDKRAEALEEISKTNERIANQQKSQLDIADALSRGDIAAAARATAELRSQQVQDAQVTQKDMLDKQRERELSLVTGPGGQTREQLEEAITALERKLFLIEEDLLEPAQERIRLAEVTRDLAIEQLELNGMNRLQFDQIAASTNLAALNMEDMLMSARKLAALGEFIQTGEKSADWEELFPSPTAPPPPQAPASSSGPAPAPAPPSLPVTDLGPRPIYNNFPLGDNLFPGVDFPLGAGLPTRVPSRPYIDPMLGVTFSGGGMIIPKRMAMGGVATRSRSAPRLQMAMGGRVKGYPMGGLIPYKSDGGFFKSLGSDTIPAMLTPGEFVIRRPAVRGFGVDNLEKINRGTYNDGSVYNYNLAVNVKSDSDPNRIARAVITNIKSIENQRIRSNKL